MMMTDIDENDKLIPINWQGLIKLISNENCLAFEFKIA